jgi:hypothetical protein
MRKNFFLFLFLVFASLKGNKILGSSAEERKYFYEFIVELCSHSLGAKDPLASNYTIKFFSVSYNCFVGSKSCNKQKHRATTISIHEKCLSIKYLEN